MTRCPIATTDTRGTVAAYSCDCSSMYINDTCLLIISSDACSICATISFDMATGYFYGCCARTYHTIYMEFATDTRCVLASSANDSATVNFDSGRTLSNTYTILTDSNTFYLATVEIHMMLGATDNLHISVSCTDIGPHGTGGVQGSIAAGSQAPVHPHITTGDGAAKADACKAGAAAIGVDFAAIEGHRATVAVLATTDAGGILAALSRYGAAIDGNGAAATA